MAEKIYTTVIGSMPKPTYLSIPGWVKDGKQLPDVEEIDESIWTDNSQKIYEELRRATQEVIDLQNKVGLGIVTNGELIRDSYINGFCRKLSGFDFVHKKRTWYRNGAREEFLPKIISNVAHKNNAGFMLEEWTASQQMSDAPVKVTIPGPLTIMDTFCNDFYQTEEELLQDLSTCINVELMKLAEGGCKQIQVGQFTK